jgi:cytochrome c oxidase subunit 1
MLYALAFIFLFAIGGLTGLFLGALATDVHLHDTYFVVAHFHYVMMGSSLMAFIGGLYYWWPKMFGRMVSENWGRIGCFVVFIAFNLTFFPQFVMGTQGMPRRYYNYPVRFTTYHQLSTLGAYGMGAGFIIVALNLVHSLRYGPRAPANPWGGATLEWQCASPPPVENFAVAPVADAPYMLADWKFDPQLRGYVRNGVAAHREPALMNAESKEVQA